VSGYYINPYGDRADVLRERRAARLPVHQVAAVPDGQAGIGIEAGLSVTARLGGVETIENHKSQSLGVTVYFGRRKGTASSTDLSAEAIRETVTSACTIAGYATEDPHAGLPEPDQLATEFPDLDLNHAWDLDVDEAIELAVSALKETMEGDDAGKIKSGIQNVTEAAMKLGEAIYKAEQEKSGEAESEDAAESPRGVDEDIVDADFEDIDDDKRA